ncbi:MAG: LuxR C-terminal-related transcriptional regulator [Caldilineaceae bacterium]
MSLPLLATKFYLPQPRAELVARPRLLTKLQPALHCPLTLISAPAGFGKSTLVVQWIAELSNTAMPLPLHLAWVSLDEGDNDPVRFWSYVAVALEKASLDLGKQLQASLQLSPLPPIEALLTDLLNRLAEQDATLIVALDDFHLIQNQMLHDGLLFLVEHLPPTSHLLLLTRSDPPLPLARWRVRRQMLEIRPAELRFTAEEASSFLQQTMKLELTPQQVLQLEERTEGWIAGLQLAALSLHERSNTGDFLESFTGSNRYIADYLIDEVLANLAPATQSFLQQIAVLDRFCAPLCAAVSGNPDARTLLDSLERSNLFIVPLDSQRQWFRFHHLFQSLLLRHLHVGQATNIAELRRRASRWCATHEQLREAVEYALAAQDYDLAIQWLEQVGNELVQRGESATLERWFTLLPTSSIKTRPRLLLLRARMLQSYARFPEIIPLLTEAENALSISEPAEQERLRLEINVWRINLDGVFRRGKQVFDHAPAALAELPQTEIEMRAQLLWTLGIACFRQHDVGRALAYFQQAEPLANKQGDQASHLLILAYCAMANWTSGRLRASFRDCQEILHLSDHGGHLIPFAGAIVGLQYLGAIYLDKAELSKADAQLQQGLSMAAQVKSTSLVNLNMVLARLRQLQGDEAGATAALDQVIAYMYLDLPTIIVEVEAMRAQFAIQRGDVAAAYAWLERCDLTRLPEAGMALDLGYAYQMQTAAEVLLHQQPAQALALCNRELAEAEKFQRGRNIIHLLAIKALIHQRMGDTALAQSSCQQALVRAEVEGFVAPFLERGAAMRQLLIKFCTQSTETRSRSHAERVLAAFNSTLEPASHIASDTGVQPATLSSVGNRTTQPQPLLEPLTERELEVLKLLASGASNQIIAERLIIAEGTVKRHVSNIMGKLGVENRTSAVARGRDLGLLA